VSLGLVTLAILSLMLLFGHGLKMNSQAEELTRSSELGRHLLEAIRAEGGYTSIIPDTVYDGRLENPTDPVAGFPPSPYPRTTLEGREYRIVVRTATESARVRAVAVEVWWDDDSRVVLETAFSL
jgi:hypothetical protein